MNFSPAESTEYLPKRRQLSENGRWEIGLYPVLYGTRVRAGIAGSPCCVIDLCAGPTEKGQELLYSRILKILSRLPEEISEGEVSRMIPEHSVKPVLNDMGFMLRLVELSESELPRMVAKNTPAA